MVSELYILREVVEIVFDLVMEDALGTCNTLQNCTSSVFLLVAQMATIQR
jgi:hypothetical protein